MRLIDSNMVIMQLLGWFLFFLSPDRLFYFLVAQLRDSSRATKVSLSPSIPKGNPWSIFKKNIYILFCIYSRFNNATLKQVQQDVLNPFFFLALQDNANRSWNKKDALINKTCSSNSCNGCKLSLSIIQWSGSGSL